MDKQKQVEEMAKVVQRDMCGDIPCEECNYNGKMKILPRYCGTYLIAKKFYNAGYRKIPENAVVLTMEEKVDLFDKDASGFMTSAIGDIPLNIDGMRKLVDEVSRLLIVQGELQDLNAKYYNEAKDLQRKLNNDGAIYSRLEVDGFIDKARKETAEKFVRLVEFHSVATMKDNVEYFTISALALKEILHEQFGIPYDEIVKEFTEGE